IFPVLPARRVGRIGGSDQRENPRGTSFNLIVCMCFGNRLSEIRIPIAVAEVHRYINFATLELVFDGCFEGKHLLVAWANPTGFAIMDCYFFQPLIWDITSHGDIAKKWQDIILAVRATIG